MNRLNAERIARLYEGFYAEKPEPFSGPIPRCVLEPIQDGPEYVSPVRFIAGWLVVLAIAGLIFWGL
jgi:hypothetical protein